jgi:DHA1 family inner membrane transport protein
MAIVVGVPLGSILAGKFSWRWMFALLTIVFLIVMVLMAFQLPKEERPISSPKMGVAFALSGFKQVLQNRNAAAALLSTAFFGIFWYGWGTYNGAFFIQTLEISTEDLAPIFTAQGLAILSASQIGGFLSDRFTKKTLAVIAMITGGGILVFLTQFGNTFWLALTLNTILSIPTGLRFVSGSALLSELTPSARGTFLSLNASAQEMGSMMGASLGGFILGTLGGYGLLGAFFALAALLAALILKFFVIEAGVLENPSGALEERTG